MPLCNVYRNQIYFNPRICKRCDSMFVKSFIDDIKHMQCIKALEIDLHSNITKHDKHIIDNAFDKAHLKLEQLHPSMRNITHNDIELLKFDNI